MKEREIALFILMDIFQEGAYNNIILRKTLNTHTELTSVQKAFVTELVNGTLRNLINIDYIIDKFSKTKTKKMKPFILNNLRIGAYQILYMDKIPVSAACNEAVILTKKRHFQTLSGFVNGVLRTIAREKDMAGKKVLITAGPTQEKIDPVRYITNHSTGKMGYALAENAMRRGAEVTLVTGPTAIEPPMFVNVVPVISAEDMAGEVIARAPEQDIIIKAAAVADYRPVNPSDEKIKKKDDDESVITLERTQDILKYLGGHKRAEQFICGFSMETENMLENSRAKLTKKNVDMIVANNLKVKGAGFGTDTNVVTIITTDGCKELDIMSKVDVANAILDEIMSCIQ